MLDFFFFFFSVVFNVNPHTKNGSGAVLEETFPSCGQCDPEVREVVCFLIGESTPNSSHNAVNCKRNFLRPQQNAVKQGYLNKLIHKLIWPNMNVCVCVCMYTYI